MSKQLAIGGLMIASTLVTFRRKIDGRRRVGFGARRGWILQTGTVLGRAPPPPRQ